MTFELYFMSVVGSMHWLETAINYLPQMLDGRLRAPWDMCCFLAAVMLCQLWYFDDDGRAHKITTEPVTFHTETRTAI
jgi:hypothetical protein